MDLLFLREQATGRIGRVNFKFWGKIELDPDEQAIVKRYKLDEAVPRNEPPRVSRRA